MTAFVIIVFALADNIRGTDKKKQRFLKSESRSENRGGRN